MLYFMRNSKYSKQVKFLWASHVRFSLCHPVFSLSVFSDLLSTPDRVGKKQALCKKQATVPSSPSFRLCTTVSDETTCRIFLKFGIALVYKILSCHRDLVKIYAMTPKFT